MRNIAFSLTTPQFLDGTKTVTRRLGWRFLRPGDLLCAIEKGQGLKAGQKVRRLGVIEVRTVRTEPLQAIDAADVAREGFWWPGWTPERFVAWFCKKNRCQPDEPITRIEFRRIPVANLGGASHD